MTDQDDRAVRFNRPERSQSEWREYSLDQFLRLDHRVRVVWSYVQKLDMSLLEAQYKAVEGEKGRNPVDPHILMALWLYATTESISSAREIDRRCKTDLAFMWICGGVPVNHHLIADFRSQNFEFLQKTLITRVAALLHAKVITLDTVAQDGMRVRAKAGSRSFKRKPNWRTALREPRLISSASINKSMVRTPKLSKRPKSVPLKSNWPESKKLTVS